MRYSKIAKVFIKVIVAFKKSSSDKGMDGLFFVGFLIKRRSHGYKSNQKITKSKFVEPNPICTFAPESWQSGRLRQS
jgi:hypothetical protein